MTGGKRRQRAQSSQDRYVRETFAQRRRRVVANVVLGLMVIGVADLVWMALHHSA